MLNISQRIQIPDDELQFTFVRSSGPGGQNVNKVNTKAVLRWAVQLSAGLPADVRQRFVDRYRHRITSEGDLILSSQRFREQGRNQRDCLDKLCEMLSAVAVPPRRRRPTKPTKASQRRRQEQKRGQSVKKQRRRLPSTDD